MRFLLLAALLAAAIARPLKNKDVDLRSPTSPNIESDESSEHHHHHHHHHHTMTSSGMPSPTGFPGDAGFDLKARAGGEHDALDVRRITKTRHHHHTHTCTESEGAAPT